MQLIHTIILAIVEGITEFLPVSSTAHLIITAKLLGLKQTTFMQFFEIFIQIGAIFAVFTIYLKELWQNKKLWILLIASFIPTGILGLLGSKLLKPLVFGNMTVIALALIIVGVLFIIVENMVEQGRAQNTSKKQRAYLKLFKTLDNMTIQDAILIGALQAIAIIPGVSRSGAIILSMLLMHYKREDAVKYSFLLGLPTISAAALHDAWDIKVWTLPTNLLAPTIIATILSFIFAFLAVKWLINYVKNHDLKIFGWYRIVLGIAILLGL